jgi:uncharacterized protein YuzE
MQLFYDDESDILYIRVQPEATTEDTFDYGDYLSIEYDAERQVVGIEITNASQHMPLEERLRLIHKLAETASATAAD